VRGKCRKGPFGLAPLVRSLSERKVCHAKNVVEYKNHIEETIKAFAEGRVLLVSSGREGIPNVMAIGWGTMGIIWKKPLFLVLVRPSRHTYKLIEETEEFTVNVVPPELKGVVNYCGTVSGRAMTNSRRKD